MKSVYVLLSIFLLLCVSPFSHAGCLRDGDTSHTAADYVKRVWNYVSSSPKEASSSSDLKFMTFNQQSGFLTSCQSSPTTQANTIKGMDYVGTQESVQGVDTRCNCNIPQIIADVTGMATRFGMAMPYRTGQYGTSLGTTQNILETKYALLDYPNVEQRIAVAVRTQPAALQGRNLWFVNVHVEYYNGAARQSQLAQLNTFVNSQIIANDAKAVVVMTGDFNGGPWDAGYATMKANGYKNSWEVFNGGSILEGNTIPVDWPGSRFDHIWYRQPAGVVITPKHVEVLNVRLSDHRPLTATLNFKVEGSAAATTASSSTTKSATTATATTSTATTGTASTTTGSSSSGGAGGGGSSSDVVCINAIWEGTQLSLACPKAGQKITQVQFASYGNPTGTCGNFKLGKCIGGSSMAVMVDKCVGKASCSFPIANNVFGDPCPGQGKHFSTQVLCA